MNKTNSVDRTPVHAIVIRRPGEGWKHVNGAVWDHNTGMRLHMHGLLRTPDGEHIDGTLWPQSKSVALAEKMTGNRRRGLMLWALWVMDHRCKYDEVYYGHQCNVCGHFYAHGCAPWDAVPEYA